MNTFIYIITDRNRNCLHSGMSTDLIKTIDFYTEMPNLFFDSAQQLNRLVYFEEINSEELAMERRYVRPALASTNRRRITSF
jgi:putative endonuclease